MIKTGKAGKGTYGIVYTAKMKNEPNVELAVKRNIMDRETNFSGSIKELDILNGLYGHPYIVNLKYISYGNPFTLPNSPIIGCGRTNKEDYLFFVFEKAERDGHSLIYGGDIHISYLKIAMVQILLGLEYMHSKGYIHRDLKPGNLLWFVEDKNVSVKICDFGLSKPYTGQGEQSPGVVTSWYRAPEICANEWNYGKKVDIWSVGCIFYEMVTKKALLKGCEDDNIRLLSKIIGLSAEIKGEDIRNLTNNYKIRLTREAYPKYRKKMEKLLNLSHREIMDFNQYPREGAKYADFVDLLKKMLRVNPNKRYSASKALNHKFFEPYRYIIEWCRNTFKPIPKELGAVNFEECKEKVWMNQMVYTIFNNRQQHEWYKHRILFQSISLYHRYLNYLSSRDKFSVDDKTYGRNNKLNSKYIGKYLKKYDAELRYYVCIYICIKYFTTLRIPISFSELVSNKYQTEKAIIEAEHFERTLIGDICKYQIYDPTPYEMADKYQIYLDEYQIRDLLLYYTQYQTMGNSKSGERILENNVKSQNVDYIFRRFIKKYGIKIKLKMK